MKSTKTTAAAKIAADPNASFNEMVQDRISVALALKAKIDEEKEELELHKQYFAELLRSDDMTSNKLVTSAGTANWKRTNSYSLNQKDVPAIKKALGKAFDLLVDEKKEFKPNAKFRELLSDGDYENIELLRTSTIIRESESVTFDAPATASLKLNKN
jgi:hypothetical protein